MDASSNPISITFARCASRDVSRDAWSDWDLESQRWVLRAVFDAAHCHDCDGEASLAEMGLHQ
jgi:hypothetical protein